MRSNLTLIGALAILLDSCARIPTPQDANDAVFVLREYDSWAWALGIALIWADLVLPVPQTAVIAALGIIYGTVVGGLLGSVGLISGGVLGYALMRTAARWFVDRLVGRQSLHKMESFFDRAGARSEEHTSELQSLMRISYAVFCLKKKKTQKDNNV